MSFKHEILSILDAQKFPAKWTMNCMHVWKNEWMKMSPNKPLSSVMKDRSSAGPMHSYWTHASCQSPWFSPWLAIKHLLMWKSLSHVQLFATPWTVAREAPLSMGFFRQEYWSGLPCPPPGDLPNPGIEPAFAALAGFVLFCFNHQWHLQGLYTW